MQQETHVQILGYETDASWRGGLIVRQLSRAVSILIIVMIAYAVPVAIYATWAWLRLRPETWPHDDYPQMDPLGLAWQYWHATPSNSVGGSSYWAAVEQGKRWRFAALCSIGVLVVAALAIFIRSPRFRELKFIAERTAA